MQNPILLHYFSSAALKFVKDIDSGLIQQKSEAILTLADFLFDIGTYVVQSYLYRKNRHYKGGSPGLVVMGRRLVFKRSWVRIPVLYTGWTFFHIKLYLCLVKSPKINEKEAGDGPFKKLVTTASKFYNIDPTLYLSLKGCGDRFTP